MTVVDEHPVEVHASLEKLRRLRALQRRKAALDRRDRARYMRDPAGWARWRLGAHLWSKQQEIAASVVNNRATAVKSCHTSGKSWNAATLASWWVDVHPPGSAMVISTAPTYDQVHGVLWEEIRNHHRRQSEPGRDRLPGRVLRSDKWILDDGREVGIGRKPPDHSQSAFQGFHRKYVLVILDEAGGVPAWLWEAAETVTTGPECRILAIGNPDDASSEFHRVFVGDHGWNKITVSAFDTPAFTGEDVPDELLDLLISREWVADKQRRWGETNPLYQAKVLGEFADSEDALIPLSWIKAAQRRWWKWWEHPQRDSDQPKGRRVFGVDVAWLGTDRTAIFTRQAQIGMDIELHSKLDTTQTAGLVQARMRATPQALASIDVTGVGAGVYDQLSRAGLDVTRYVASATTKRRDSTGSWRFDNVRTASWWNMRELLDPSMDATIALPDTTGPHDKDDIDELVADLTTPGFEPRAGGVIHVESKDEIRKRLKRSTDAGDACVQAWWEETPARDGDRALPDPVPYRAGTAEDDGGEFDDADML